MTLDVKIADFINKAMTRSGALALKLKDAYDREGYQSDDSKELLLQLYSTSRFIKLLQSDEEEHGGMTDLEVEDTIDFFWKWIDLNPIAFVEYPQMPIVFSPNVTVPSGLYALQADLLAEINTRQQGYGALDLRITELESFDPSGLFPDGFFDNLGADASVVFDDDVRLHTHGNKVQLDAIDATLLAALQALGAHYASVNGPASLHITTAERTSWNARVTAGQLANLATIYAAIVHSHSIPQIVGLEAVIAGLNEDIATMGGIDGDPGREVELQLNGYNLEWRYVGDAIWIDLGDVRGPAGAPFTIGAKGAGSDRFNAAYNGEDDNFTFLDLETGLLYYRNPSGGAATISTGWETPLTFLGNKGWSPVYGTVEVSPYRTVMELVDWVGGSGDKPLLDPGINPPDPVRWYLGPVGLTLFEAQATNIKGSVGPAKGPVIGAADALAGRGAYDDQPMDFMFLRTDATPNTVYFKISDASGDWSAETPWQGPPGPAGPVASLLPGIAYPLPDPYDASSGLYPEAPLGSGVAGIIMRGNIFDVSVGSPPDGDENVKFPIRSTLRALVDNPGQDDTKWKIN